MAFRTRQSECVTRLIVLRRLTPRQWAQCEALRREAGRCWASLVGEHKSQREQGYWMSARELEIHVAHGYALHSQTVQALAQRLDANVQTARVVNERLDAGSQRMAYPYRTPEYQTVIWKDMAIRVEGSALLLSNGRGREALRVSLPEEYRRADIRRAELVWRADHFELCLNIDSEVEPAETPSEGVIAGIDLGEVHIAAVATSAGEGIVVTGRLLRSCKRLRNKRHACYQSRRTHCVGASRRATRLKRRQAQASARFYRQQRDILHQASRKVALYCRSAGVSRIAVGDVRDIQDGVALGSHLNQKIAQWPHGQFVRYLSIKAARLGMSAATIAEDYSTRTCSHCGYVAGAARRGRRFACAVCGAEVHRDVNGAANICSRACSGVYGTIQVSRVRFVRPVIRRVFEGTVAGKRQRM